MDISKAVKLIALATTPNTSITQMSTDNNTPTLHSITHSFREELIVPYIGIENNMQFFLSKGLKQVITSDGILANVKEVVEKHICDLDSDIIRLYNIQPWDFLLRWHRANLGMDSMTFVKLKLERISNDQ